MEFFEFVLIFSIVFVLPLTLLKTILDYKKARLQVRSGGGEGVTAGELRRLLREAVEEANAPLIERIAELEAHVRPPARLETGFAGEVEEPFDEATQERTLGRRVHE